MRKLSFLLGLGAIVATAFVITPALASGGGSYTCNGTLAPGNLPARRRPPGRRLLQRRSGHDPCGPVRASGRDARVRQRGAARLTRRRSRGGVHATNATQRPDPLRTINGGIDIQGGSGPFGGPFDVTWNTIEDSTINGGDTESGYDGFWNGFFRNTFRARSTSTTTWSSIPTATRFRRTRSTAASTAPGTIPRRSRATPADSMNQVTGPETGQCVGL